MEKVDCNIIKDLLPNYNDGTFSEETNRLITEHLKTCKNCNEFLKNINNKVETEEINEKIDYLKGYRRNKIRTVIFAIAIGMIILLSIFLIIYGFYHYGKIYVDVNQVNVEYIYKDEESKELVFYLYSEKYKKILLEGTQEETINSTGNKEICIKMIGKPTIGEISSGDVQACKIEENLTRIYMKDQKGKTKEIWNKDTEVMTEEEWIHWYVDKYMPKELKEQYKVTYENFNNQRGRGYEPFQWRHLYDINL